jgi:hypothetical protein
MPGRAGNSRRALPNCQGKRRRRICDISRLRPRREATIFPMATLQQRWLILTAAPHRMFFATGLAWLLAWSAWWAMLLAARAAGGGALEPARPALLVHGAASLFLAYRAVHVRLPADRLPALDGRAPAGPRGHVVGLRAGQRRQPAVPGKPRGVARVGRRGLAAGDRRARRDRRHPAAHPGASPDARLACLRGAGGTRRGAGGHAAVRVRAIHRRFLSLAAGARDGALGPACWSSISPSVTG